MKNRILKLCVLMLTGSVLVSGCREDEVRQYSAPKPQQPPASASPAASQAEHASDELQYKLPESWKKVTAGSFLLAAFEVDPAHPEIRCTVSLLGGGVLPNINRWRQQVGLADITEADLPKETVPIEIDGHPGITVSIQGPAERTLGAIVEDGPQAWFFKLKGPIEVVAAQKENFDAFLKSVRLHGGKAHE